MEVDISTIVRQEVMTVQPLMSPKHRLDVDIQTGLELTVRADPVRLAVVVRNLLDNAIKYSPHGGTIGVRIAGAPDQVSISVEDEGVVIKP